MLITIVLRSRYTAELPLRIITRQQGFGPQSREPTFVWEYLVNVPKRCHRSNVPCSVHYVNGYDCWYRELLT